MPTIIAGFSQPRLPCLSRLILAGMVSIAAWSPLPVMAQSVPVSATVIIQGRQHAGPVAAARGRHVVAGGEVAVAGVVPGTPAAGRCAEDAGGYIAANAGLPLRDGAMTLRLAQPLANSAASFNSFVAMHQASLCAAQQSPRAGGRNAAAPSPSRQVIDRQRQVLQADLTAVMHKVRGAASPAEIVLEVREIAHLRTVMLLAGFAQGLMPDVHAPRGMTSAALSYNTGPAILALLERIRSEGQAGLQRQGELQADAGAQYAAGVAWARGLSEQQLAQLIAGFRDLHGMTAAAHDELAAGVTGTRAVMTPAGGWTLLFPAYAPPGFVHAFRQAELALGYIAGRDDTPAFQLSLLPGGTLTMARTTAAPGRRVIAPG